MFKSQRSPSASKVPKAYEYIKYNIGIGLDINFNYFQEKKKRIELFPRQSSLIESK
jgi:hypothetical protein